MSEQIIPNLPITKRDLLVFVGGVAIASLAYYLIFAEKGPQILESAIKKSDDKIELGWKGKGIEQLQIAIKTLVPESDVDITGTYDRRTKEEAVGIFEGTRALIDPSRGKMEPDFVWDLTTTLRNISTEEA